jgi:hypothetical protein
MPLRRSCDSIRPAYALVKQGQQNDDRDWKAYQPQKDITHIRLRLAGLHCTVFSRADDAPPRPVTELPALDRRETGRKCSDQQGGGQPHRQLGSSLARLICGFFCLVGHFRDSFVSVCRAHAGLCRYHLCHVRTVGGRKIIARAQGRPGENCDDLAPRGRGVFAGLTRCRVLAARHGTEQHVSEVARRRSQR